MSKSGSKSSQKVCTKYIDTLDSVSRSRYESKLTSVKNVDPYENTEWSEDVDLARFPPVKKDDISDYLVHRTSYYTRKKFKAEKALGAHKQLTLGWVNKISTHTPHGCDNTIVIAQVDLDLIISLFRSTILRLQIPTPQISQASTLFVSLSA